MVQKNIVRKQGSEVEMPSQRKMGSGANETQTVGCRLKRRRLVSESLVPAKPFTVMSMIPTDTGSAPPVEKCNVPARLLPVLPCFSSSSEVFKLFDTMSYPISASLTCQQCQQCHRYPRQNCLSSCWRIGCLHPDYFLEMKH